jgi:MFS family permease
MAYQGAAWNVGMIVGPSLGGLLAHPDAGPAGFRIPLFVASGLAALCVLAIILVIRESNHRREGAAHRVNRWSAIGDVTRNPVLGRLMLLTFLVGFAFTGIESTFGLWASERFGWTPREIGVCFAFVGVSAAISQMFLTGPLSERYGEARMLTVGMALTVLGAGLQVLSPGTAATIALMCVTAIGQSVAFPNVGSIITRTADPHRQGQILGLNNACGALARVVGPFCAGLIFPININGPFLMGALIVIPAIFLAISASRRAPKLTA